jgi:hypothetical protein
MATPEEYPKPIKRKIRQLAGLLYERALAQALKQLEREFARWRQGRCDPFELEEQIHAFHEGPARQLFTRFGPQPADMIAISVAQAIASGQLTREEAGPEVLEALRRKIETFEDVVTSDLVRRAAEKTDR